MGHGKTIYEAESIQFKQTWKSCVCTYFFFSTVWMLLENFLVISLREFRNSSLGFLKIFKVLLWCLLAFALFSVKMIPHRLSIVKVRALERRDFFSPVPFLIMAFWQPSTVRWDHEASVKSRWINWESNVSLRPCVGSLLHFFLNSYCQILFTCGRYCLGLSLLLFTSTCPVSSIYRDTLHNMLRYSRFWANSSLEITLLMQK